MNRKWLCHGEYPSAYISGRLIETVLKLFILLFATRRGELICGWLNAKPMYMTSQLVELFGYSRFFSRGYVVS